MVKSIVWSDLLEIYQNATWRDDENADVAIVSEGMVRTFILLETSDRAALGVNWEECIRIAMERQQAHFDAKLPAVITENDAKVADQVANNLVAMLERIRKRSGSAALTVSPRIPGYQWIASGVGDFSTGTMLIEVKCTNKHFSSSDYRQILFYWLLSYAAAIESGAPEWSHGALINPRLNLTVEISFDELVRLAGGGMSKIEMVEVFSSMMNDKASHALL